MLFLIACVLDASRSSRFFHGVSAQNAHILHSRPRACIIVFCRGRAHSLFISLFAATRHQGCGHAPFIVQENTRTETASPIPAISFTH